jgi:threonine-phosphate decarboxylase
MELHGGNIYKIGKQFNIDKSDIIDFSSNINPLGISEILKKEIINNFGMLQSYPDPDYTDLRFAISEYNRTNAENILIGNGATELIFLFARSFKYRRALIVAPTFIEYAMALDHAGTKIDYFKLEEDEGFVLDIGHLKKILGKSYDLLVICNPNNPTSGFIDSEKIEEIIAAAKKSGTTVLLDESFIEFINLNLIASNTKAYARYGNLFILRSLTKFFAIPGLRLGYALAFNRDLRSKLKKNREPWTVNQIADLAGRVLLKDKAYIQNTYRFVNIERNFLYDNIAEIKWLKVYKPYANFLLLRILNNIKSSELKTELLKHNILIRDAANFKFLNNKFIRIAVKDRQSNELLVKQLRSIGN